MPKGFIPCLEGVTNQLVEFLSLAGLVAIAGGLNPIPSRTRPLNSPAPMVLSLKTWKSRSLPGLRRTEYSSSRYADSISKICQTSAMYTFSGVRRCCEVRIKTQAAQHSNHKCRRSARGGIYDSSFE